MVDDSSYIVDDSWETITYGRGLYHRLRLISKVPKWRPTMYLRDDKLKEYSEERIQENYDNFVDKLKVEKLDKSIKTGQIIVKEEGAFIRCLENGIMVGFLHIPDTVKLDLKDRLTAELVTKIAKEIFRHNDFGLYYCGIVCPPGATLADFWNNSDALEMKTMEEFAEETELRKCQESLRQMTEKNQKLKEKIKRLDKQRKSASEILEEALAEAEDVERYIASIETPVKKTRTPK